MSKTTDVEGLDAQVESRAPQSSSNNGVTKYLTAADILSHKGEVVTEVVQIPEWNGQVIVRGMSGSERDMYEKSLIEERGRSTRINLRNLRAKLIAWTVFDPEGNRLFSQAQVEELGALAAKPLQRIYDVSARLSGISEEDVKELTEDFGDGPSDDSGSV